MNSQCFNFQAYLGFENLDIDNLMSIDY